MGQCFGAPATDPAVLRQAQLEVDTFLQVNEVDANAQRQLRAVCAARPEVALAVIARGTLSSARNASSVLASRIRAEEAAIPTAAPAGVPAAAMPARAVPPPTPAVATAVVVQPDAPGAATAASALAGFLAENPGVDASAVDVLQRLPLDTLQLVIDQGSLRGTINPSAVVLKRVSNARKLTAQHQDCALHTASVLTNSVSPQPGPAVAAATPSQQTALSVAYPGFGVQQSGSLTHSALPGSQVWMPIAPIIAPSPLLHPSLNALRCGLGPAATPLLMPGVGVAPSPWAQGPAGALL